MIWPAGMRTTYWLVSPDWRSFGASRVPSLPRKRMPGHVPALQRDGIRFLHDPGVAPVGLLGLDRRAGRQERENYEESQSNHSTQLPPVAVMPIPESMLWSASCGQLQV